MHRTKNIKTTCILALFLGVVVSSCSNGSTTHNRAQINFQETRHDFGTVTLNEEVSHDFAFTNPGEETLMIQDIHTSCGCTVPEWPTKPIKKEEDRTNESNSMI